VVLELCYLAWVDQNQVIWQLLRETFLYLEVVWFRVLRAQTDQAGEDGVLLGQQVAGVGFLLDETEYAEVRGDLSVESEGERQELRIFRAV